MRPPSQRARCVVEAATGLGHFAEDGGVVDELDAHAVGDEVQVVFEVFDERVGGVGDGAKGGGGEREAIAEDAARRGRGGRVREGRRTLMPRKARAARRVRVLVSALATW